MHSRVVRGGASNVVTDMNAVPDITDRSVRPLPARRAMLRIAAAGLLLPGFAARLPAAEVATPRLQAPPSPLLLRYAGFLESGGGPGMRIAQAQCEFVPSGARYALSMKVSSPLAQLAYESSGLLDQFGLHPRHYRESRKLPLRGNREKAVEFIEGADAQSARRSPSTSEPSAPASSPGVPSASTPAPSSGAPSASSPAPSSGASSASAPVPHQRVIPAGAQDRLSVLIQMSLLARSDPHRAEPGATWQVTFAGFDGVDTVRLQVGDVEEVDLNATTVRAQRVRRIGSDTAAPTNIDFWMSADEERSPVVIRFEDDGRALRFVRAS